MAAKNLTLARTLQGGWTDEKRAFVISKSELLLATDFETRWSAVQLAHSMVQVVELERFIREQPVSDENLRALTRLVRVRVRMAQALTSLSKA